MIKEKAAKKLLVVCGLTATGKTQIALELASLFNGELISADSRQVYQGMDIGTGKDIPRNAKFQISNVKWENKNLYFYLLENIPIWLYDVVRPNIRFSVADYVRCSRLLIKDVWRRGELPILVGGTGFYIKAILDGITTLGIPPDWKRRRQLEKWSNSKLFHYLEKLNPHKAVSLNNSDRVNPRRLIRAIEVASANLKISKQKQPIMVKINSDRQLIIGLKAELKILSQRIDKRVEDRIKQGIEKEITTLLKMGYHWQNSALGRTLGYQEWEAFFQGKTIREEVIQAWKNNEHAYARRQMTWFKKDKRIFWFDISQNDWHKQVIKRVKIWLIEDG